MTFRHVQFAVKLALLTTGLEFLLHHLTPIDEPRATVGLVLRRFASSKGLASLFLRNRRSFTDRKALALKRLERFIDFRSFRHQYF